MGVSPAKFESANQTTTHYIPGNYSRRNTVSPNVGVATGNLCILGRCTSGKPKTLYCFTDKTEVSDTLGSGELYKAVINAFTGSATYIPQQVYCMRVENATQSKRTLYNGKNAILEVKSSDYGTQTNQIKMWLSVRPTGRKLVVAYKNYSTEIDSITKPSFSILYAGEAESVTCTIDASGLKIVSSKTDENLTISFTECDTLISLVQKINENAAFVAIVLDPSDDVATSELDYVTDLSLKSESAVVFYSDLQALISALESVDLIGDVSFVGTSRILPDNDDGYIYFAGATDGSATSDEYKEALGILENEDIQILATTSSNINILTLIANHCKEMSSVSKKRERTCILGLPANTSIDDACTIAKQFNSEFVSLVITSANATNAITNKSETITPPMLACKCAGIESALSVSLPLTNKTIKVNSFSVKYKDSELNKMIAGGIMPFGENDDGDLVCIRGITTYQSDSLILNERSMIRSVLYMDRDLRKTFNSRIGTNSEPSESSIIQTLLNKAKEWYANNLLTKSDSGDFIENAKVTFDGDKCYLTFDRYIRAPNNFTFITATNKVYSSTVEV